MVFMQVKYLVTLRLTNIAMENGPFEDVFPSWTWGFSIAMFVYQRVIAVLLVNFSGDTPNTG